MKMTIALILTICLLASTTAFAHSGRTDSNGGHNKTSDGTYHYHDGSDRTVEYSSPPGQYVPAATPKPTPTPTPTPTPAPKESENLKEFPTIPNLAYFTLVGADSVKKIDREYRYTYDVNRISLIWTNDNSSATEWKNAVTKAGFTYQGDEDTVLWSSDEFDILIYSEGDYMIIDITSALAAQPSAPAVATPSAQTVYINGKLVAFDAYLIDGSNYFKLRDLAFSISGTEKQFDVGYDNANKAIALSSGKAYTVVGGEMASSSKGNKTPTPTVSKIYLNGQEVTFTAYMIDGNNYFKLRDVGRTFNFGVSYDAVKKAISIITADPYIED